MSRESLRNLEDPRTVLIETSFSANVGVYVASSWLRKQRVDQASLVFWKTGLSFWRGVRQRNRI